MFSTVRRQRRPLGYSSPESRIELQLEKALFRQNAQLLRDMCDLKLKQKRREEKQQYLSIDKFPRHLRYEKSTMEHNKERQLHAQSYSASSTIAPEVRWLLTRSARLQRANDAGFSKYSKPIRDRVVSANGKRGHIPKSFERQRSMCSRNEEYSKSTMQKYHCELLGPSFCSDCTQITEKVQLMYEQAHNFPRIEVHTRSLVAPERVERMFLSHPEELFNQKKSYACGCPVSPELEITTPLVYTPHEIFTRIRRKKNIELGNELIRREQEMNVAQIRTNTPVVTHSPQRFEERAEGQRVEQSGLIVEHSHPSFYEEKTDPPLDMKISVSFRNDGPR